MKKQDLTTLAMIGISAGLLVGGCQQSNGNSNGDSKGNGQNGGSNHEQMSPDMESFYTSLSSEAQDKFSQLDAHGKMMAMEMAKQSCKGQNACKGMGGCATSKNTCAGKNSCKGQGGAPVKDSNEAVHATHYNQMKKQNGNGSYNGNGKSNGSHSSNGKSNGNGSHSDNGNGRSMKKNGGNSNSCAGPGGCGSKN